MGTSRTIQISNLPVLQDARGLVVMLEDSTEKGSVYACRVRTPRSSNGKMYAHVQFESHEWEKFVHERAKLRVLYFRGAKLTVDPLERDIVSKPRSMPSRLENVKLYMGNLISQNKFSYLWSSDDSVVVEFGFDIRKLSIYLNECCIDYKMELAFSVIRYIHYHNKKRSLLLV